MSEEQTLTDADVGGPGVEKRAGYPPMPMAHPSPAPDLTDFTPDESFGPKEAGEFIARRREEAQQERPPAEAEPQVRAYVHQGGEKSGEPRPSRETVELDRASRDISGAREAEDAAKITALEADLLNQLDSEAANRIQSTEPQHQPNPVEPEPMRPEAEAGRQSDELIAELERSPKLLHAFSVLNEQTEQRIVQTQNEARQYAEQVGVQYAAAVQQNALAALSGLVAQFPELQGLQTHEQLATAIQTVARGNPERGRQISDYIQRVQNLTSEAQRVQQVQQQQYLQQQQQYQAAQQQQFQRAADAVDTQFDAYARTQVSDAQYAEIKNEVRPMLRDYGLSDQDVAALWNTPYLRSFASQAMLMDAARWRLAQNGAKTKAIRAVPTVQRPGSPAQRAPQESYDMRLLESRLNQSGSPRDAAALLSARRGARR